MQKYTNDIEIRYFEDDVNVSDWIDLSEYRLMTESEILKHESNPNTDYHVWDEVLSEWKDGRTSEQIAEYNRTQMPTLTPIEFDIKLVDAGLYDQVQSLIKADVKLRIAYTRATFFSRTDQFIEQARIALNLTDEQVDEMWTS